MIKNNSCYYVERNKRKNLHHTATKTTFKFLKIFQHLLKKSVVMAAKGKCFYVIITLLIHSSHQLNSTQQIKDVLISITSNLPVEMKLQLADYLKGIILNIQIIEPLLKPITEGIENFKSEIEFGQAHSVLTEMKKTLINTIAYGLNKKMSLENLNRALTTMNEEKQTCKTNAARYLTIYLEHNVRNITDKLTQYSEKVIDEITANTVQAITRNVDGGHERNNEQKPPSQ